MRMIERGVLSTEGRKAVLRRANVFVGRTKKFNRDFFGFHLCSLGRGSRVEGGEGHAWVWWKEGGSFDSPQGGNASRVCAHRRSNTTNAEMSACTEGIASSPVHAAQTASKQHPFFYRARAHHHGQLEFAYRPRMHRTTRSFYGSPPQVCFHELADLEISSGSYLLITAYFRIAG